MLLIRLKWKRLSSVNHCQTHSRVSLRKLNLITDQSINLRAPQAKNLIVQLNLPAIKHHRALKSAASVKINRRKFWSKSDQREQVLQIFLTPTIPMHTSASQFPLHERFSLRSRWENCVSRFSFLSRRCLRDFDGSEFVEKKIRREISREMCSARFLISETAFGFNRLSSASMVPQTAAVELTKFH